MIMYKLDSHPFKKKYPIATRISHYPYPKRHPFDKPYIVPPKLVIPKKKKIIYQHNKYHRDMTYILGARCKDGVVLVGDTKITVENDADFEYDEKINYPFNSAVFGSAGVGGIYKNFQNMIMTKIREGNKIETEEKFLNLVSRTILEMRGHYGEDRYLINEDFGILCASRIGGKEAHLTEFNGYGIPEPINGIRSIGHGYPHGKIFTNKLWNQKMTMEQTAKLGLFIIEVIKKMKLDYSVGYSAKVLPQVAVIPDIIPSKKSGIGGLERKEIKQYMKEVKPKVTQFQKWLKKDFKI